MVEQQQPSGMQYIVIMRHGKRHDTDNPTWNLRAAAPWDTPLSARGVHEIEALACQLNKLHIQLVVVSPFLRCMQTAHRLLCGMQKPEGGFRVVIERQLSEVYHPTLLHLTENPGCLPILHRWSWQRQWMARAKALLEPLGQCHLEFSPRGWPSYPETHETGHKRFCACFDHWVKSYPGNILFVTHGDAVLAGLQSVQPEAWVDAIDPGAFMILRRSNPLAAPLAMRVGTPPSPLAGLGPGSPSPALSPTHSAVTKFLTEGKDNDDGRQGSGPQVCVSMPVLVDDGTATLTKVAAGVPVTPSAMAQRKAISSSAASFSRNASLWKFASHKAGKIAGPWEVSEEITPWNDITWGVEVPDDK